MEFLPLYLNGQLYIEMAKDYINTLHGYDKEIVWDEMSARGWMWNGVFLTEDGMAKGFIITENVGFNGRKSALYIAEMYVEPEYRRTGVGLKAIRELTKDIEKDVFLYILHQNFSAKEFWDKVEEELRWERIKRPEIREERNCELRVYKVR